MKTMACFILCLSLTTKNLDAQSIRVLYQEQVKATSSAAGTNDARVQAVLEAQLKKMNRTMCLYYQKGESLYVPLTGENNEEVDGGGAQVMRMGGGGVIYKNQKNKELVSQEFILDKKFIITEVLPQMKWQITGEEKEIGGYLCKKALGEDNVIAWFCPDLAISDGPRSYTGLPGLILEIDMKARKIVAQEITPGFNVSGKIQRPDSGKKISKEEFETLRQKKMASMGLQGNGSGIRVIKY